MKLSILSRFSLFLLSASLSTMTAADDCKVVETVEDFNITEYAQAPWYIHQQAENSYSPIEQNYCVRAKYIVPGGKVGWFGYSVEVNNQAQNEDGDEFGGKLCAYQPDDEVPSKLAVAPCWLPKLFAGPYWIVAYNETEGYALVSGGQPDEVVFDGNGTTVVGCRTGTGTNNAGLWIFSRSYVRNEELIETVREIARDAGFDTSVLNNVNQTNCGWDDVCEDSTDSFETTVPYYWLWTKTVTVDCNWEKIDSHPRFACSRQNVKEMCPASCGECD